jgi:glucose-6-phosphate 1-dehydrogenase
MTAWHEDTTTPVAQYESRSAGPAEAEQLLDDGRTWRRH